MQGTVCSTTRVKSAIVFSLVNDGSRALGCRIFGRLRPVRILVSLRRLGWLVLRIFLPRRVLGNPLHRVMFRNKTPDYFRFAIGPQNIDPPARAGIFPRHKSWSLLGHPVIPLRSSPCRQPLGECRHELPLCILARSAGLCAQMGCDASNP
jgi:hypothetical protein